MEDKMIGNMEILAIVRVISALFAILGLYYSYKLFTLVRYTKYWSYGWGFFMIALLMMVIRRIYLVVFLVPCNTQAQYFAEYQSAVIPCLTAIFAVFIWAFYTKYLGIHSNSITLRHAARDEIRDKTRDLVRDKERDAARDKIKNHFIENKK
jgi:hypothetical protein